MTYDPLMSRLAFQPIDLKTSRNLTVHFREDSFIASFGDADKFHGADGKGAERYITWLQSKIAKDPNSVVHVLENGEIIGQIEMDLFRSLGLNKARLSVSPSKKSAMRFYEKLGWRDLGPRLEHPEVHFMEKMYNSSNKKD